MSDLKMQLEGLYAQHKKLTPKLVVDAARDPDSPLHGRFEWDDSVAGERYREIQASVLIRSVKVTTRKGDDDEERYAMRAFHSLPRPDGYSYVPAQEIREDPQQRELLLRQAKRELTDFVRRYEHFEEFFGVVEAARKVA